MHPSEGPGRTDPEEHLVDGLSMAPQHCKAELSGVASAFVVLVGNGVEVALEVGEQARVDVLRT